MASRRKAQSNGETMREGDEGEEKNLRRES